MLQELTDVKLSGNPDKNIMRSLEQLCHKYAHLLKEKELDYLTNFEMKTSNFNNLIKTAITDQHQTYVTSSEPMDLKLRPVAAGPACTTYRMSNLIDVL